MYSLGCTLGRHSQVDPGNFQPVLFNLVRADPDVPLYARCFSREVERFSTFTATLAVYAVAYVIASNPTGGDHFIGINRCSHYVFSQSNVCW